MIKLKTFKIEGNDLVIDENKNLVMIEGHDEESQSVERILSTNHGEWFLNILFGLNYNEIQGKGKNEEGIRLALIEAISQETRVKDIEFIDIRVDNQSRALDIKFKILMDSGNYIMGGEVVSFG